MTSEVTSPSGRILRNRGQRRTTPQTDTQVKEVRAKMNQESRLSKCREELKNVNVQAFLRAISDAEGGEYNFLFGAVKGRRNDRWRFSDYSTHPGPGADGATTAAGVYQINKRTWADHGTRRMGLTDFTPETQDLIAVSMLDGLGVIGEIKRGDIEPALGQASKLWAALPQGRGMPGRHKGQRSVSFEHFSSVYQGAGGTIQ
jgi:muramidase (phage lysozyme)